jgi:multisubunit Na+/H+ antiporter MnhC subunit
MSDIYAPVMRALVVVALVLATATLMFVAVNTVRAANVLPSVEILLKG